MNSILLLLFSLALIRTDGCYIWGTDSGRCTNESQDAEWRAINMPFCGKNAIQFPACVPQHQTIPPSREFPEGRFNNHTVLNKDNWVAENALNQLSLRIGYERNKTLFNMNVNEFGDPGHVKVRFYKAQDCQNAFLNYFCWINFPRCDPSTDETLPTCKSACENFFITCGYESKLWRCGDTKFFNGYFPESISKTNDGNTTYLREYFPGQPFVQNKFRKKTGEEEPICTPAVRGDARSSHDFCRVKYLVIVLIASMLVWLP